MINLPLQKLYNQLSRLRLQEARGQNVRVEIQQLLEEIAQIESSNQQLENNPDPQSPLTQFDVSIKGDAIGSAIGPNATVTAEIISGGDVQRIDITTTRHENYSTNPGPFERHPSHTEVIAGEAIEQAASRIFWRAPRSVAVSILMLSPISAFFTEESIFLGMVGLITITPLCAFVLWQTRFFNIPEFAYKDKKLLIISSWIVTILGIALIVIIAMIYYIIMLFLTVTTGALREQIRRY